MKNLLVLISFIFFFSTLEASEVSEWFEKESKQFLDIINNNEGTESENYEKYKYFINKNFAVKSIAYGLIGEKIIEKSSSDSIIIRTSWLYSMYGNNFVKTMIKKGEKGEKIYVINDQFGCPTYSKDLVDCTLNIIVSNKLNKYRGYNFSNEGYTNWYDFTKKIFELKKISCDVVPVDSNSYETTVTRPKFSVTDKSRIKDIFKLKIRSWDEALEEFIYNYK